ncbi:MAG: hypothetical protein U5R06_22240 [candidate division KSB1 bacterium]|nr:hypothetical protein [candidate division KSB1 bacterium]
MCFRLGDMASSVAITYNCQELINLKTRGTFYVDWSPDKTMLVYCKHYNIENGIRVEIWTMNSDGSEQKRISGTDTLCYFPEFSPSGDKIMYTATNRFSTRIVVCDVNGNFKKTALTSFQATNIDTSCVYGMDWKNESEIIYNYWGRGMTGYMKAASYKINSKEHFSLAFLMSISIHRTPIGGQPRTRPVGLHSRFPAGLTGSVLRMSAMKQGVCRWSRIRIPRL